MGITVERKTKETQISITFDFDGKKEIAVETGLPFFDHILTSFSFHGGMSCCISASGDIEVDPHHLVEDIGLVFGECLARYAEEAGPLSRFGSSAIPMDDSLSEVIVDVCGRPYLVYRADYPQRVVGTFDIALIREFLLALTNRAAINLHCLCRYGENSHHMAESLFKALGKALNTAYSRVDGPVRSTKGSL